MRGKDKIILEQAINAWGVDFQVLMAIEELGELQHKLIKYLRHKPPHDDLKIEIAEEMADVEIMMDQMRVVFQNQEAIGIYRDAKIGRLQRRIQQDDMEGAKVF